MNPLFFLVIIFVIDILLKSAKNKKKMEEARSKRTSEIKPVPSKGKSIMQTIREEMEKEAQRQSGKVVQKQPAKRMVQQKIYTEDQFITHDNSAELKEAEIVARTQWSHDDIFENKENLATTAAIVREKKTKSQMSHDSLRRNILNGIIFSEIIAEPKSIKNQRKSM